MPRDSRRVVLETKMRMNRKWFDARRMKFQPLFGEVQTKYVTVKPNTTECAKKVFNIDAENPDGKKIAKGLTIIFTPDTLSELTDEDPILGKLKRACRNQDFKVFKKADPKLAQFYSISSVSREGILLVDNRIAIPEGLRKAVLSHLHRGHPGQEKMVDAAEYIWWPRMHREIIKKAEDCSECTAYGKNV